jgi:DegT/DnrJ/EryC1/StrS aminotransferase family
MPEARTGTRPQTVPADGAIPVSPAHPDRPWIAVVRSALDWWATAAPHSPTSSVLGGGAIAAAEAAFSEQHEGRLALLLPSATYALRVALQVVGVAQGDEVICGAVDWPSGYAAILSLGAVPVPVLADQRTLTLGAAAAAAARTSKTRAVVACHLHGVCADVPAIRRLMPGLAVIEDAAQAFGCRLDGRLAGTMGDAAVLSLGPGKQIDAGEGGVLLCGDRAGYDRAVMIACHPLRQLLAGLPDPDPAALGIRPHPAAAVLALHRLAGWSPASAQSCRGQTVKLLAGHAGVRVLGVGSRHVSVRPAVPVLLRTPGVNPPPGVCWTPSGAQVLPGLSSADSRLATDLLARVRLASAMQGGEDQ